jgi:hypothetical protein
MDPGRRGQMAYLIRLWQERNGERVVWRASLQDVHGGKPLGFADLDRTVAYLRHQMGEASAPTRSDRDPEPAP